MKKILVIVGSGSHVLNGFVPDNKYDQIIKADRTNSSSKDNHDETFIKYDLENYNSDQNLIDNINKYSPEKIDIIFASYSTKGLKSNSNIVDIGAGLTSNIARPLKLFNSISNFFSENHISGIFISSMYARNSPNKSFYDNEEDINPLYYGAAKAAVDQGIKWLSCQRKNHVFNSISLGAMPKETAKIKQPKLMRNLIKNIPANRFITHEEVFKTINYMLNDDFLSLRGVSLKLDGGYSLW